MLYEAIERFVTPAETEGGLAIYFGVIGLVANMISLSLLMRGQKDSLNVRGAFLEVAADALGSVAVIISAGVDPDHRLAGRRPDRLAGHRPDDRPAYGGSCCARR